nr:MAG TPA: hypothetical protein [Caudoviricetes sp.]
MSYYAAEGRIFAPRITARYDVLGFCCSIA